ncbi:hypothetical protein HYPSUDRAFT_187632 [Hypholoma sublateritium FD-334 SS-4]|uniref:Uncharacterized protein n=1 Tax=Hypholoma sublateritium (strain FD-334 SS-4) TaxID=945553 RepID=A0A0D2L3K7_HYPSF|nr:hypothetical protein HYPSUDRAFT_187632 [Hypholoma sublateritium FD-334 SS-4]
MASTSTAHPQPPELDFVAIAKTTRKTLDRLASFAHMQRLVSDHRYAQGHAHSSDENPLLTKILNKISTLIHHIDSSMLVTQLGYQLASDALIFCDTEAKDWEADVTHDTLRDIAGHALEISTGVMEGFREIKQEVYKIAASTKDDMFLVLVPADSTHSEPLKIHLKDVGTDLVANLGLLSDYSRSMTSLAEWCQWVKADLSTETPSLLPAADALPDDAARKSVRWAEMKDAFQEYYNVVHVAHLRFPELLGVSAAAWKAVTLPGSKPPSTAPHSVHEGFEGAAHTARHGLLPLRSFRAVAGAFTRGRGIFRRKHSHGAGAPEKGKDREEEHPQVRVPSPSSVTSPSRYSLPSQPRQADAPQLKGRFSFSCCSINLFHDGVALLENHCCMIR